MRTLGLVVLLVGVTGCRHGPKPKTAADYALQQQRRDLDDERRARAEGGRLRREAERDDVRPARADYRGQEGWQQLRWGMSLAEVFKAMDGHKRVPLEADQDSIRAQLEAAEWLMTVADHEARVTCFFVSGRLAQVMVAIPEIKSGDLVGLLSTRYGTPDKVTHWDAVWQTLETVVSAHWGVGGGKISYVSEVLKPDLEAAVELWKSRRAKDL